MDDIVGQILEVKDEKKRVVGVLWDEQLIQIRVIELAAEIAKDYKPILDANLEKDLVLVGILNGAVPFLADLFRELSRFLPEHAGRLRYDFLAISSYGLGTSSKELRIEKDLKNPIAGDIVLIIEDVIDTGYTAVYFKQLLLHKGAIDVKVCTLTMKTAHKEHEIEPDYVGFDLEEDLFIVGYGLDWADKCRGLGCIAFLEDIEE